MKSSVNLFHNFHLLCFFRVCNVYLYHLCWIGVGQPQAHGCLGVCPYPLEFTWHSVGRDITMNQSQFWTCPKEACTWNCWAWSVSLASTQHTHCHTSTKALRTLNAQLLNAVRATISGSRATLTARIQITRTRGDLAMWAVSTVNDVVVATDHNITSHLRVHKSVRSLNSVRLVQPPRGHKIRHLALPCVNLIRKFRNHTPQPCVLKVSRWCKTMGTLKAHEGCLRVMRTIGLIFSLRTRSSSCSWHCVWSGIVSHRNFSLLKCSWRIGVLCDEILACTAMSN